ncbi:MAG: hypothetical protein H7343_03730 [Undibacterium sp.]|nr:hypothetical protein [Opitutaceae bacterium]
MNIEEAKKYLQGYAKELAELIQPGETRFEELIHLVGRDAPARGDLFLGSPNVAGETPRP